MFSSHYSLDTHENLNNIAAVLKGRHQLPIGEPIALGQPES